MGTGVNGTYLLVCCEQGQPLGRGQRLGPAHRVEAGCCYGFAVENCSELFAPFAKDALYELGERLPWVAWSLSGAWANGEHRARYFWCWPETTGREHGDLLDVCKQFHHHADRSVCVATGFGHQAVANFALDRYELAAAFWMAFEQCCNQWRRGLVRKIGNQREWTTR